MHLDYSEISGGGKAGMFMAVATGTAVRLSNHSARGSGVEFNKYKYDPDTSRIQSEVVGTFTQYPLTLAWATTIHKSQGKTFDRVTLDLTDRAFEHGQVYVALSRCRTIDGLSLRVPLRARDIMVDTAVEAFFKAAGGQHWVED